MKRNPVLLIFAVVLSLLYGIIAAGQILGFLRLYRLLFVVPLSLGLSIGAFLLYWRWCGSYSVSFDHSNGSSDDRWLSAAFILVGILLYILLIFFPLIHWPYSPISTELTWDAGLYHFPKAAEMISTGSAWDLSIAYGEYPFGYESLIAFALLLNHGGWLIGSVHALLSLFLFLALGLLIFQHTRIPRAPVLLLLSLLFLGYQLAPNFDSNIWWIFWPQITMIGKNDLFLAAACLAVILHTPTSREGPFFPPGLAMASMIALSIKPNSALVLVFAWAAMLFFLWRSHQVKAYSRQLGWSILIILPGALWIIRNLVAQGVVIRPDTLNLSGWSIAGNLTNPFFYKYIPQHLYYVLTIILLAGIVSIFKRSLRFDVIVSLLLLFTFTLTPASAFLGSTDEPAQVAWRFAMALLAYVLILLLRLIELVIFSVYRWISARRMASIPLALFVLLFGGWCIWMQRDLIAAYPENVIVLRDQYSQAVGVDGYYSAYDYVQKNVHNSVVIIENGLPYYLYDLDLTNSITRSRPADYIVYLQTPWLGYGGYPATLDQPAWSQVWALVYQDSEGRVYKHK